MTARNGEGLPLPASSLGITSGSAEHNLGLLQPAELAGLKRVGMVHQVNIGTLVVASGAPVTHVLVVVHGELELMARLDTGRTTMAVVRRGGVICDVALLIDAPEAYDAIASRDTELISLSQQQWNELLAASPSLSLRWMTSIAHRLFADRQRLVMMATKSLLSQLAYLLLELREVDADGLTVVRLSHSTLGQLLGARRQSISRALSELRDRALVESSYGLTVLLDEPGLRAVIGREPLPRPCPLGLGDDRCHPLLGAARQQDRPGEAMPGQLNCTKCGVATGMDRPQSVTSQVPL